MRSVRSPIPAYSTAFQGEGVSITGALSLHAQGFRGAGAKVTIIDLGFEGLDEARQRGEVPTSWRERDFTDAANRA